MSKRMLRLFSCFTAALLVSVSINAQYYYKDIMSNMQLNKEFSILKSDQFRNIKLSSFEDDDQPSKDFYCEKKINKDFSQSQMISRSYITGESLLVTDYNPAGKIIKATTTTPTTTNIVKYAYNNEGQLSILSTSTSADNDSNGINEIHEFIYDQDGKLQKMLRKKNNLLMSTITFLKDEHGNIIEEDPIGKSNDKKYFYYYNDQNQLTDVVHFNERAQRLLPDYMFEYNQDGLPKQMISIDETASNYFIWKYAYTPKNLVEIQKCFSKEKRLLGTIQYDYK